MKTNFSIKKALSVLLSFVLVVSSLYIGATLSEITADAENTTTTVREEEVSFNDYQMAPAIDTTHNMPDEANKEGANADVETWIWSDGGRYYSGQIIPTYDPTDVTKNNIVLRHRPFVGDTSVIRLSDDYLGAVAEDGITVEENVTYKIQFKWMTEGVAKESPEIGIALSKAPDATNAVYVDKGSTLSECVVVESIANGTAGNLTWTEETVYFTVTEDMNITDYSQLVIYAYCGGSYNSSTEAGYGLSIYFDDIKVSSLANYVNGEFYSNDYQTVTPIETTHALPDEGTDVETWIWNNRGRYYSGQMIPMKDPTDATNYVLRHRPFVRDTSVIRLSDDYLDAVTDNGITVVSGKTYKIKFKWMTEGVAKESPEIGIALSKAPDATNAVYVDKGSTLSECVVVESIANGTAGNLTWTEETVYFTVTEDMNITDYSQLVIYAYCGGSYKSSTEAGYGLSIYFDDVSVTAYTDIEVERYGDEVLANNDYQTVTPIDTTHALADEGTAVESWIWGGLGRYYSGQMIPMKDPTDATNYVLRHRPFVRDTSVIRLSDDYLDAVADNGITVTAGTTYKINFKWMTEGVAKESPEIGIALSKAPDATNAVYVDKGSTLSECVVVESIANGTAGNLTWTEETVYFTVTEDMNITDYSQLVIYAYCGGSYKSSTEAGYGLSIYFDDVSVSVPAAATATYQYVDKDGVKQEITEYFADGLVADKAIENLNICWYDEKGEAVPFTDGYYDVGNEYAEITLYGRQVDKILANNDYQTVTPIDTTHNMPDEANKEGANADVETWIWSAGGRYYSGQIIPTYDPTDVTKNNIVLRHRPFVGDTSVIRLSDDYLDAVADNGITVTAGTTYKINFKWMTEGVAKESPEIGIALSKAPDATNAVYVAKGSTLSECVVVESIANGTAGNLTWTEETVYFTVTEDMNITDYSQLVIYAYCGGSYNSSTEAGYGLSIYFDDVSVCIPAPAKANYRFGDEVNESIYYSNGDIEDYQPLYNTKGITITWYTDEELTNAYDFDTDYTEYKEITLYGKGKGKLGDVTGNGTVDSDDIIALRDYLIGTATDIDEDSCDINEDNVVDVRDLIALKKMVEFPEGVEITSVALSLYEEDEANNTYTYGVAWQTNGQFIEPVVEIIPAAQYVDETSWDNAVVIKGTSANSVAYDETYELKDAYTYDTISGWNYNATNFYTYHDNITMYTNKLVISGLTAGVTYKYRVGDGAWEEYSSTAEFTAYDDADSDGFDFVFMTDSQQPFGAGSLVWDETLQAAFSNNSNLEFITHGGDLINYNNIERQWTELLHDDGDSINNAQYVMNNPIMPTAGNHEYNGVYVERSRGYDFNNHFNLSYPELSDASTETLTNGYSGTYYSYDYKNVHFVVLNTNEIYANKDFGSGAYELSATQVNWLKADLEAANADTDIDYTIVYMHHSLYSVGGAGLGSSSHETKVLRTQLQGIFAEYGVDLVMGGHDHIYSVTEVLNGNGAVVTDGTSGVVYMTGAVAGNNSPGAAAYWDREDVTVEETEYNTRDKYNTIITGSDKTRCWTELSVTSVGIEVTTYSAHSGSAVELDTFTIQQNNVGTTFE